MSERAPLPTDPRQHRAWQFQAGEAVCDRFESAWRGGDTPVLEQYLDLVEGLDRAELLGDLLGVELHYRQAHGERIDAAEYHQRFREFPAVVAAVLAPPAVSQAATPRLNPGGSAVSANAVAVATIPGYEVLEELGRGGMGVVFKARQVKANRVVALKMILSGNCARPDELARFRTEAEALARLQHPNIVPIYEVNEHQGLPYFSLEFCAGGSLERKLNHTPLRPTEAAALVETLARAMAAAHGKGVVHRDLKPANVLLAEDGTPKITDFGLAKQLDAASGQTHSGQVVGTPSYMAPEQAAGKLGEIGPVTDVYALGGILYEVLTGRPPFKAASVVDTLHQVVHDEPAAIAQLNARVPRDLETICLKCLQKQPQKRYERALELADDLGRFRAGEPICARPVRRTERLWRWCRRNPLVAGLLSAVFVSLALGLAGATYFAVQASTRARQAEDSARAEQRARARAEAESYFLGILSADAEWRDTNLPQAERLLAACPENQRRWEWYYLRRLCQSQLHSVQGHRGRVLGFAASPDGQLLASVGADGVLCVWDGESGRLLWSHYDADRHLDRVAFSRTGARLATIGNNRAVHVWDGRTGQHITSPVPPGSSKLGRLVWSPQQEILAVTEGAAVLLWNLTTGKPLHRLEGHALDVDALAFSPDGKRLASASRDRTLKVWEVDSGKEICTCRGHQRCPSSVLFTRDGQQVISATAVVDERFVVDAAELVFWDATTGQEVRRIQEHCHTISGLALSQDGRVLALASAGKMLELRELPSGRVLRVVRGRAQFEGAVFLPGERIAAADSAGNIGIWDISTDQRARTIAQSSTANAVSFAPDGLRLATAHMDGTVRVSDTTSGRELLRIDNPEIILHGVAFSPEGTHLAAAGRHHTAQVWDAANPQSPVPLKGHKDFIFALAYCPTGNRLITASKDATLKLWNAGDGRCLRTYAGHEQSVIAVAVSPNGQLVASGSIDRTAKLWDVETGRLLRSWRHAVDVPSLAFSPDGAYLATGQGTGDAVVRLWHCGTGDEVQKYVGHEKKISGIAFCPLGERLATTSDDGTVRLWEVQSGRPVLLLRDHTGATTAVAFSRDGRRLATAGWDRKVKVWDARVSLAGQGPTGQRGHD